MTAVTFLLTITLAQTRGKPTLISDINAKVKRNDFQRMHSPINGPNSRSLQFEPLRMQSRILSRNPTDAIYRRLKQLKKTTAERNFNDVADRSSRVDIPFDQFDNFKRSQTRHKKSWMTFHPSVYVTHFFRRTRNAMQSAEKSESMKRVIFPQCPLFHCADGYVCDVETHSCRPLLNPDYELEDLE